MRLFISEVCFGVILLVAGCGGQKEPTINDPTKITVFNTAKPEVKVLWDLAVSAVKTNGYVVAVTMLQEIRNQPELPPDQLQAAEGTLRALKEKLNNLENAGDAAAIKAMEELRSRTRR